MNEMTNNFQKLLEKYHFVEPIGPDVRARVIEASRQRLTGIIKGAGDYSFIYGMSLSVYYKIRRAGYRIGFSGAKIALAAVSAFIIASIIIGGYFVYRQVTSEQVRIIEKKGVVASGKKIKTDKVERKTLPVHKIQYKVRHFSSEEQKTGRKISRIITANLKKIFGSDKVAQAKKNKTFIAEQIIMGNIKSFNDFDIITAKVINARTGEIEFVTNETVNTDNKLEIACKKITQKIYLEMTGKK